MDHRDEIVHKLREPLPQLHQDEVQLRQEAAELIEKDGLVLSALPPSPQGPAQTEAGELVKKYRKHLAVAHIKVRESDTARYLEEAASALYAARSALAEEEREVEQMKNDFDLLAADTEILNKFRQRAEAAEARAAEMFDGYNKMMVAANKAEARAGEAEKDARQGYIETLAERKE